MKAIILAAGQGTRLRPITNSIPKCLVKLHDRSLLDHQIKVLQSQGIDDIHVVAGYLSSEIQQTGITLHFNHQYSHTNMVHTLFCASKQLDGSSDLIISYGDIIYESLVLSLLQQSDAPISLVVDKEWMRYWQARMDDPLSDAETMKLLDDSTIIELGKKPTCYEDIEAQYIGLIKVRKSFVPTVVNIWHQMDKEALYDGNNFENMYMTSFLQHIINLGYPVKAVFINNGWLEIDSLSDLVLAENHSFISSTNTIVINQF